MADVRNDQYLHRPGAGRGAVSPADPLEARLYDGAGQPIAPATEGKQDQIISALGTLANALGTEATLALVKAGLDALAAKDFATEATLAALKTLFGNGGAKVQLTGQINDIAANRPDADTVDVGTVYWSVDTGDVSVSTGTTWRSLGVA